MSNPQPATTRHPMRTVILALLITGILALRGIELGWPTPLTVMVLASLTLLTLAPAAAAVERRRARVR